MYSERHLRHPQEKQSFLSRIGSVFTSGDRWVTQDTFNVTQGCFVWNWVTQVTQDLQSVCVFNVTSVTHCLFLSLSVTHLSPICHPTLWKSEVNLPHPFNRSQTGCINTENMVAGIIIVRVGISSMAVHRIGSVAVSDYCVLACKIGRGGQRNCRPWPAKLA